MPKLEFDVNAKDFTDAERQASELIAAFVGDSGLKERSRTVEPFHAHAVDTSTPGRPHQMIPVGFGGHYTIDLG